VGSDDGLIDHLTLVRDRQAVLRGQFTELLVGEAHNYWITMIIKQPGGGPAEIFASTQEKRATARPSRGLASAERHKLLALGQLQFERIQLTVPHVAHDQR
jgi:hypothetical protein